MAELGMIEGDAVPPSGETIIVRHSHWERARRSGIVRIDVFPGQAVERGEVLGIIGDALGTRHAAVRASRTGIVLGYTRNPLVSQGDALVHLADLSETARGGPARPPT
jgi:predicted deacylase